MGSAGYPTVKLGILASQNVLLCVYYNIIWLTEVVWLLPLKSGNLILHTAQISRTWHNMAPYSSSSVIQISGIPEITGVQIQISFYLLLITKSWCGVQTQYKTII